MKPTPELRRHYDVEQPRVDERAFRQGWRIRTRLDGLLAEGRITRGQWQAATEFRAAWVIAREITGREPGIRVAGGRAGDAATIARLEAASKVRTVEDVIGKLATALVTACVVEDLTWASIARYCHRDPHTVRAWTILAIRALFHAWGCPTRRQDDRMTSRRQGQGRAA